MSGVQSQTFTDWELLIVDDCSTDSTSELVEAYAKQDSRIKLYKTPRNSGGPATPKNIGVENAQGKYVAFLDHDDEWLPEKLEKQLKLFESSTKKELGLVTCFFDIKNTNDNKTISKRNNFPKENILENITKGNFIVTSSCVMTKLSILKEVGLFDKIFKISDDWDMWLRILNTGYSFDFTPEYLLNYFVHDKNACYGNNNFNEKDEFVAFYEKHKELFLKYNYAGVGYYYFALKNYKLSRKYYTLFLLSKKSSFSQKIKSLVYVMLSCCPSFEGAAKSIWRKK